MAPRKKAAPRESKAKLTCKLSCCTVDEETKGRIAESAARWKPGLWAEENNYGPACTCGLRGSKEVCGRHGARGDHD